MKNLSHNLSNICYILLALSCCQTAVANHTTDFDKNHGIVLPDNQPKPDWIDTQHHNTSKILNKTAKVMNNWFGTPDPNQPAKASLRVIFDTTWQETDGTTTDIKLRGKVKLPTLEKKLSIIFGDERLDESRQNNPLEAHLPENQRQNTDSLRENARENASLAMRWSNLNDKLPFNSDFDIGIRSRGNVFVRLRADKDWQIAEKTKLYSEQTYRYSKRDKNEFISHWDIQYQQDDNSHISTPTNFHYKQTSNDDLNWNVALLQNHHYHNHKKLSYGLYADGFVNSGDFEGYRHGAVISWRQPIWRKWLYLQTDIDYLANEKENRNHEFGALLRLEAVF